MPHYGEVNAESSKDRLYRLRKDTQGHEITKAIKIKKKKINLGICIASTQPFWAALSAESRVCYPGNTADRQTQ
jgi:hypothetical protein